jgi:hypothetical protein
MIFLPDKTSKKLDKILTLQKYETLIHYSVNSSRFWVINIYEKMFQNWTPRSNKKFENVSFARGFLVFFDKVYRNWILFQSKLRFQDEQREAFRSRYENRGIRSCSEPLFWRGCKAETEECIPDSWCGFPSSSCRTLLEHSDAPSKEKKIDLKVLTNKAWNQ